MCVYIYVYKYIYIYVCVCTCVCVYIYIYMYIYSATYDMDWIPLSSRPRRCAPTASAEALHWQDRGLADLGGVAFKGLSA